MAVTLETRYAIDPMVRTFLDRFYATPVPAVPPTPREARDAESRMQDIDVAKRRVDIQDGSIPGPSGLIDIRITRPLGRNGDMPVVMYFHGGGWVVGDRHTHDRLVRELAHAADAAVVFVEYSRSPEARYPVAIEEAYAATAWIKANGASVGIDSSRLAVVGDSAGGNMAAAVTLLAKARGGPTIDCQVLFCPAVDATGETRSAAEFADGYFLTRAGLRSAWEQYMPVAARRHEPLVSPLLAQPDELAGLPPGLVITAELDVLRDEGEAYARRLMDAGVTVTATRYLGTIHAFMLLNALARTPAARAAIAQAGATLREALV
jgi:acetyl esterase